MEKQFSVEKSLSKIKRVVITEEQISERIKEVGAKLTKEYDGKPLLLLSILKGSFVFMADLCREIKLPCKIEFMCAKSYYEGTCSSGEVIITKDIDKDLSGYHVVIVEDIVDTGRTLVQILQILKERNPLSLKVVSLLDKPSRRVVEYEADEVLFSIPDFFVIGYGLDCGEEYRNLPYIAEYDSSK